MSRYTKSVLAAAILASASAVGYAATSATSLENDALAISKAKISLTQAITAAEQHVNGKAVHAEYEDTKSGWAYDVEVASGTKVYDVKVDADKGTVISSTQDKVDQDDSHDKKD
ncbi:PepSY domain-containing protein [Eoetvoesiella caeni]|uniref:Peptidase YpeB-like protein n=1 Tax=Eoetvoesiella caeni TaxID=645616 RepID=A0A366H2D8_9BURK|nr:PepSY domain-containing protein [Eoetvoesiella caeni]MCI2810948.1 PepSY domain-containing protein [Eoetvoesiella caeni]NYT56847.1 PepSY domain-containing protein [Eoetvoesiella caeni]RBP35411.1 peptidase YpeB-like protein [Eoetvoesiella caeni]